VRTADSGTDNSPLFYVEVRGEELDGQQFEVGGDGLLIGRSPTCDVIFESREVSRRHCYFYSDGTSCCVQDLGSKNGIAINGRPAKEKRLAEGDVVNVGPSRLTLRVEGNPHKDEAPTQAAVADLPDRRAPEFPGPRHPLAISALVFALLAYVHWAFGFGALVLALLALYETRKETDPSARGMAIGALVLCMVGAGMNAWFTEATPPDTEREELVARLKCRDNLNRIATALAAYQAAHKGAQPARLQDLVTQGLLESRRIVCPAGPLAGGVAYEYLFFPRNPASSGFAAGVVACDRTLACHHASGGWVLRSDGHPEWMPRERFAALLAELVGSRRPLPSPDQGSAGGAP